MVSKNKNEPYILNGFSYSEDEKSRAKEIRNMEDSERKDSRIKYFEIETGKKFPTNEPLKQNIALNRSKTEISSNNARIARTLLFR
ncbi:MAG: hypothetical protein US25_C0035G0007 [Candidatus Moranbacteria bacterium GW2011_GWE1_36_7]|nr:MAG: hypothetical protein US25_C0035G0007 [Candidatus Moranbacteria bacterium GW2011_GWE1_36_7]